VDTPLVARKPGSIPAVLPHNGIVASLDGRDWSAPMLQQAPDVTARDVARLAEVSGLPIVAKGVLRSDMALRCLDSGAAAVIVSTHGGRQLDGVVSVPEALPEVAAAVGERAEVYADGGVRTGIDVVRALALGARAVLVGRPVLWALAVGGADGVRDHLSALTAEVREAFALAGCMSCADVGPDLVGRR
jgi:4-hydroxymandelate oxidase